MLHTVMRVLAGICIAIIMCISLSYLIGYFSGTVTIHCKSNEALGDLLGLSLNDAVVKRVKYSQKDESTLVCVWLDVSQMEEPVKYTSADSSASLVEFPTSQLPPGIVTEVEKLGISSSDVSSYRRWYCEIRVGYSNAPYEVFAIRIHDAYQVVLAWVPRRVIVYENSKLSDIE